jgi:hypothetical protein
MTSADDIRATRTRPFATTVAAAGLEYGSPPVSLSGLPEQGSIVGLQYRLVRVLGEGNFGKVWVAERLDVPEHRVAMKILPRSHFVGRNVERELVMLATVGHPNVVQLKDHGIEPDFVWLTMPVYQGETLGERLSRGTLKLREAYDIFLPIARALEALHQLGLRHQDVKPDNIFLSQFAGRLHPVLLDLGVAAEKDATFVAGTALFAAPEQLAAILANDAPPPLSEKIDSYCLAATLLLCLVGDRHFPGGKAVTRRQVAESHELRATQPIVPAALLDLSDSARQKLSTRLAQWMSIDPDKRPTMTQVAEELEVLLEPEREAEEAAELYKKRQERSLARTRIGAVVVLAAALGVGGLALWKRETLRMASALEEARAAGEENFDKLDTCTAAHTMTRRDARNCAAELSTERSAHERTLNMLSKQGAGCKEVVTEIQELRATQQTERKKHEDELKAEVRTCGTEREKLTGDFEKEREKLTGANTTCEGLNKDLAAQLVAMQAERDTCLSAEKHGSPYDPDPNPTPTSLPTARPTAVVTSTPTGPVGPVGPVEPPPALNPDPTPPPPPFPEP